MRRMRWAVSLLFCAIAPAGELEDAIAETLAAADAGNAEILTRHATSQSLDPWYLAEELCKRGAFDTAAALARSSKHIDVERLGVYVTARRKFSRPAEEQKALNAMLTAREPNAMVKLHAAIPARDDVGSALADQRAGKVLRRADPKKAAALFERSAQCAARIGWYRMEAASLNLLANTHIRAQEFEAAVPLFERAARMQERRQDPRREIMNRRGLAVAQRRVGDIAAAIDSRQRAFELERDLGKGRAAAKSLEVIGVYSSELGDLPRARRIFEQVAAVYSKLGFEPGRASALDQLASTYSQLGDFDRAELHWDQALELATRLNERALLARVLGNRGIGLRRRGDFAGCIDAYEASLRMKRAIKDTRGEAITLSNLGGLYKDLGDYDRALRMLKDALAIHRRNAGHGFAAGVQSSLAALYLDQGEFDRSRECLEQALVICRAHQLRVVEAKCLVNLSSLEQKCGRMDAARTAIRAAREAKTEIHDSVGIAVTYITEAMIEVAEQRWEKAAELYQQAYSQASGAASHDVLVRAEAGLARCSLHRGKPADAMKLARSSAARAHEAARMLPVTHAAAARSRYAEIFHTGTTAAFTADDADAFLGFAEEARAASLLESLGGETRLRSADLPEEMRAAEDTARAERRVAVAALRRAVAKGKRAEARDARSALDAVEQKLLGVAERSQRTLRRQSSVVYPQFASLDELRKALQPDEAFLLYASLEDELGALVVTATEARMVSLGRVAGACQRIVTLAADASKPVPAGLAERLLAPLKLKDGIRRLLISPDGVLSYVPFSLLTPDKQIVFLPSASTLVSLRASQAEAGEGVLALGDPTYGSEPGAPARLPNSGKEAKAVGDVVLVGESASRPQLLAQLADRPRWRALHFACHGLLDVDRPLLSALELAPTKEDSGHLTVLDIYRLSVPADLVTLSACETAKGKLYRAEGVIGLTRAFMQAGVPRIVSSLWKVDDAATAALMGHFYAAWKKGKPPAAALREAQAHVRAQNQWRHPAFWAAWQLWGLPE
jgi:CHAT domain-containing protein